MISGNFISSSLLNFDDISFNKQSFNSPSNWQFEISLWHFFEDFINLMFISFSYQAPRPRIPWVETTKIVALLVNPASSTVKSKFKALALKINFFVWSRSFASILYLSIISLTFSSGSAIISIGLPDVLNYNFI